MVVTTEQMVAGGDCVAHADGKRLLVPFTAPGEVLDVEETHTRRDCGRARILRVREPSPHRIAPVCPLYGRCGGCTMQHLDGDYQRTLRATLLAACFSHAGVALPEDGVRVTGGDYWGYRARIQLHDGSFYARKSHDVMPLKHCPVATAELNAYLAAVPQHERPRGRVQAFGDRRVTARKDGITSSVVLARHEDAPRTAVNSDKQRAVKSGAQRRFSGTVSDESQRCDVVLCGRRLGFDVRGFFQSNLSVLEMAIPLVTSGLCGAHALDLYSGVGTFSAFLAEHFDCVTLVEHNRDALVSALQNVASARCECYGVSCTHFVSAHAASDIRMHGDYDACIIDPPRGGMEQAVRDWLCGARIPHLRCLSCDAPAQARDVASLIHAGYRLTSLHLLDFYPQTAHIESLACLTYEG